MTTTDLEKSIAALPFEIGDGTLVRPRRGGYYVSDDLPPPGAWARLRRAHPRSGLWPVFFQSFEDEEAGGHWDEALMGFTHFGSGRPVDDADQVLAQRWEHLRDLDEPPPDETAPWSARSASFARAWPGIAPRLTPVAPPDEVAEDCAERLVNEPGTRLGLVPAGRGADVPVSTGWWAGDDTAPSAASAVLRSWEDRFGARLIRLGHSSMVLSVAAPVPTLDAAAHIAAEHYALCPESVGYTTGALISYAEELVGAPYWSFWWERDPPC